MSDTKPYCFSKPHITARATATATSGSSTALPPWSNCYIYAHTELDEHHFIIVSWCQLCKYSCCRDPVSCFLPVLSHCPVLRNIFVVKILLYSVPASLLIALLKVASRRQSSGGVVVRLSTQKLNTHRELLYISHSLYPISLLFDCLLLSTRKNVSVWNTVRISFTIFF